MRCDELRASALPCLVNGRVLAAQAHELQHRKGVVAGDRALDGRGGRRRSAVCERLRSGRLRRTRSRVSARALYTCGVWCLRRNARTPKMALNKPSRPGVLPSVRAPSGLRRSNLLLLVYSSRHSPSMSGESTGAGRPPSASSAATAARTAASCSADAPAPRPRRPARRRSAGACARQGGVRCTHVGAAGNARR
jgi:hypothetical protein